MRTVSVSRLLRFTAHLSAILLAFSAWSQVNVTTNRYDNARSGGNFQEADLTTTTVAQGAFGKLFSHQVDGAIYAQPLYVSNVLIPGKGMHNVVYIATEADGVYAFDADDSSGANSSPLWYASFANPAGDPHLANTVTVAPGTTPMPSSTHGKLPAWDIFKSLRYHDLVPEIGITGTPVIDTTSQTLFVVAATKRGTAFFHHLHALDLATGKEKPGSPALIQGHVAGAGDGADRATHTVSFQSRQQLQRPGLLLANSSVYVAFSSIGDRIDDGSLRDVLQGIIPGFHGWIFRFDSTSLQRKEVWCSSPNGVSKLLNPAGAGIWMSGCGPACDAAGNLYVSTGNGDFNPQKGDFGDSIVKLDASLNLLDYFTPSNQEELNKKDLDLGSGGAVFFQEGLNRYIFCGGKGATLYALKADSLGKFQPGDPGASKSDVVTIQSGTHHIHGAPVYWRWRGAPTPRLYVWPENDVLQSYSFWPLSRVATGTSQLPPGMPGGILALSANGDAPGSGIVWASCPRNGDANDHVVDGALYAFNAMDPAADPLWRSTVSLSDEVGDLSKFCAPTIANGHVYLATHSCQIEVYGRFNHSQRVVPTDAAFVEAGARHATNLGGQPSLLVGTDTSRPLSAQNRCAYLKLKIPSAAMPPRSALLTLVVNNKLSDDDQYFASQNVGMYSVADGSWSGSTLTYDNAPGLSRPSFSSLGTPISSHRVFTIPGTITIDITGFVQTHLGQTVTLQLMGTAASDLNKPGRNQGLSFDGHPILTLRWFGA